MLDEPSRETDSLFKVLPSSSTVLEKDLLRVTPFDAILMPLAQKVADIGEPDDTPEEFLDFVLAEHGLSALAAIIPGAYLYRNVWELIRGIGTVWAAKFAASATSFTRATVTEASEPSVHFPEFGYELGSYLDAKRLYDLYHAAKLLKPLRSRVHRFTHGWDEPMLSWGDGNYFGLLSNESGVWVPDLPYRPEFFPQGNPKVWLSIARRYGPEMGPFAPSLVPLGEGSNMTIGVHTAIWDGFAYPVWSEPDSLFEFTGTGGLCGTEMHTTSEATQTELWYNGLPIWYNGLPILFTQGT